jgi:hypothetical protein
VPIEEEEEEEEEGDKHKRVTSLILAKSNI